MRIRKLWWLSLAVLLLGNAIDTGATYVGVRAYGPGYEGNLLARWLMGVADPAVAFILMKLLLGSILAAGAWYLLVVVETPWVGIRLSTFVGFLYGIFFAAAGTGFLHFLVGGVASLLLSEQVFTALMAAPSTPAIFYGVAVGLLVTVFSVVWRFLTIRERRFWQRSGLMW